MKWVRVLWLIWICITNSYVLDGHLIRAQVKIQVCEIGSGPVWIKTEINSLSYCKWDVLYQRYDRRIMGNEFRVILMILLLHSIMLSRMKKLNCVKFSPSCSLSLILALPHVLTLGPAKRADGRHGFFPFIHFLSATQECFFFILDSSDEIHELSKDMLVEYVGLNFKECLYNHICNMAQFRWGEQFYH